jgi:nitroreductase
MIDKQAILDAFHFRHACKEFDPARKISPADFDFILETGRLSPSSFGYEPWRFLVIQNMALRERLLPVTWGAQKTLPTASHYLAVLVRKNDLRYDSPYLLEFMRRVKGMNDEAIAKRTNILRKFQESDFRLLESERALFDWGCKQAYIALGNMMTAAAMIGIDSCPIEGFERDPAERILTEAGVLDQGKFGLAVMVAFGYRVNPQSTKSRQSADEVVAWCK